MTDAVLAFAKKVAAEDAKQSQPKTQKSTEPAVKMPQVTVSKPLLPAEKPLNNETPLAYAMRTGTIVNNGRQMLYICSDGRRGLGINFCSFSW